VAADAYRCGRPGDLTIPIFMRPMHGRRQQIWDRHEDREGDYSCKEHGGKGAAAPALIFLTSSDMGWTLPLIGR
jgi:hypothetical protein